MSTPAAAQAETAATPAATETQALPENTSAAAAKFVATKEAKAAEAKPDAKPTPQVEGKPKQKLDPNLVKREREATTALQRANEIEAKFKPLTEALAKKDLRGALNLMAADHGVTFADFVSVLTEAGDPNETVEVKAERIARETIEKAKAEDAKKADADAKARAEQERKQLDARVVEVQDRILAHAEADPERWELASLNPVVAKDDAGKPILANDYAWRLIEAHWANTNGRERLEFPAVLDIVEEKLRAKRNEQRAKKTGTRDQGATGQARNEADGQRNGGRAEEPRINNRTTSGASGVRPARDPNAPVRFDKPAINEAMERAGLSRFL